MLGAEFATLGPKSGALVVRFREENERFVRGILEQGRKEETFSIPRRPERHRRTDLFAILEGELLIARGADGPRLFFCGSFSAFEALLRG